MRKFAADSNNERGQTTRAAKCGSSGDRCALRHLEAAADWSPKQAMPVVDAVDRTALTGQFEENQR
jgi:hypothetical protein